jgi:hypothetical protein
MAERLVPVLALLALLCSSGARALESGQALPEVRVEELGELKLDQQQLSYGVWDSNTLVGKLHVVQYLAARLPPNRSTSRLPTAPRHPVCRSSAISDDYRESRRRAGRPRGFVLSELDRTRSATICRASLPMRGLGLRPGSCSESSAIIIVRRTGGWYFP